MNGVYNKKCEMPSSYDSLADLSGHSIIVLTFFARSIEGLDPSTYSFDQGGKRMELSLAMTSSSSHNLLYSELGYHGVNSPASRSGYLYYASTHQRLSLGICKM